MINVGLTGSIAVGKSFVAEVLSELGAAVLDADLTAREVVEPQTVGWQKIVENFGRAVLNPDDTLDRAKLGTIVFANREKRELLNQIVHPLVINKQNEWLDLQTANHKQIAVIDAALMIESGGYKRFDKIIVVWCEPEIQLERLMTRNNLPTEAAQARIAAQMPQAEKKQFADFLIDSSNGFADTRAQTARVYDDLLKLV